MTTIALTGGIASGKTTISNRLRQLGAVIIDADEIAREVVAPGSPALTEIARRFGEEVLTPAGTLDRAALASIVFQDSEALEALNDITHPAIRQVSRDRIRQAREDDGDSIIVHDIPLLAENRSNFDYDEIWVADAPASVRLERLLADRLLDRAEAQARIDAQVSDEQRRLIADVVIDTTAPIEETRAEVDALFARLLQAREDTSTSSVSIEGTSRRNPDGPVLDED